MSHVSGEQLDEEFGDDDAASADAADETVQVANEDEEEQDAEELGEDEAIDTEDFEASIDDLDDEEEDDELQAANEELSQKEQNARSLAIRRAIEQRMEKKQLEDDLDYLDLDVGD